jgi:hypothetical protein
MFPHGADRRRSDRLEISKRFRHVIEDRIARLEADAALDEAMMSHLENLDHIRRQIRLVAVQREEASRMRTFLQHSSTRLPNPMSIP